MAVRAQAPPILTTENRPRLDAARRAHRTEHVVEVIREAIGVGRLEPGDRLVEKRIASELGTSRGPVREALRELVHEGLVTHVPYRGAFVLGVSEEEVHSVLIPIRLTLEKYAFARALPHLGEREFAEIERIVDKMEEAAGARDLRSVVETDVRFHEYVLEVSQLPHTPQIWRGISSRIRVYFYRYDRDRDLSTVVQEHLRLLAALRSGEAEDLERLLVEHIAVPRLGERAAGAKEAPRWPR